ncbi:MAG: biotin--[acetyl-CoA-carboxylase] ligase [Cyanobacteria bacterium P01_H01_bin.58]
MDHQRITEALNRPAQALGVLPQLAGLKPQFTIQVHDSLSSTNKYAWHLVDQGSGAGTVVIAREQKTGQGQWGRTWRSPPGGLYLSLILEPDVSAQEAALLTLASAWGIVTCFNNLAIAVQLKWPNDLIYQGRKVGGILTETRLSRAQEGSTINHLETSSTAQIRVAVVGVGINWLNPTPDPAIALASVLSGSAMASVQCIEDLGAIVLRGIHQGYTYWQMKGAAALIAAYQTKLANLGQIIQLNGHSGRVLGVSSDGNLEVGWNYLGQKSAQSFKPGEISLGYNT